ncbi:MAG: hypothetical protein HYW06_02235 [Gemmatimonadetes bacterium]|nr:hypothetical protein [Gemmatimonadota bacterium]
MDCSDFLGRYSDFRDGLITDPRVVLELERHRRVCRRCARYHYAVSRGVDALRGLGEIEPSPAFRRELRARLAAVLGAGRQPALTPAGLAAAVLVAVAGALLVYEGLAARRPAELARERRSMPIVVVNPSVPFVSFTGSDAPHSPTVVVPASASHPGADAAIAP